MHNKRRVTNNNNRTEKEQRLTTFSSFRCPPPSTWTNRRADEDGQWTTCIPGPGRPWSWAQDWTAAVVVATPDVNKASNSNRAFQLWC